MIINNTVNLWYIHIIDYVYIQKNEMALYWYERRSRYENIVNGLYNMLQLVWGRKVHIHVLALAETALEQYSHWFLTSRKGNTMAGLWEGDLFFTTCPFKCSTLSMYYPTKNSVLSSTRPYWNVPQITLQEDFHNAGLSSWNITKNTPRNKKSVIAEGKFAMKIINYMKKQTIVEEWAHIIDMRTGTPRIR